MAKEVKKAIHDSLQGGSSLFNMDFASDGLSWVKGICQSFETSCNECVDACNNYVNTAGEQIKRVYDEVCEWENPSDGRGPISGSDLKHDTMADVSNESLVDLVKVSFSEKLSACDQKQPIVSIPEDSDLVALSNNAQSRSHGITCDGDSEDPLSTGAIYCSDDSGENCKETSDTFTSPADPTSLPVQDCSQLPESHHDGEPSTISVNVPSEVNDIAEVSDGREEFTSSTTKMLEQSLQTEEFEAIKVEDFWDDAKKDEVALISHCRDKNMSFEAIKVEAFLDDAEKDDVALISHCGDKNMSLKTKLRNAFGSHKGYKGYNRANYQYESNGTGIQNGMEIEQTTYVSSLLKLSSSQESIESGWELL